MNEEGPSWHWMCVPSIVVQACGHVAGVCAFKNS